MKLKILGLLILTSVGIQISNKTLAFYYDGAGNLIRRSLVTTGLRPFGDEADTEQPQSMEGPQITVYPNPTDGPCTLEISDPAEFTVADIYIYDIMSGSIQNKKADSPVIDLDFSGNAPGIYIIQVITPSGETYTKLIKK
ncbi:MAG: T9SS type A sorting domain-containing protein [Bacteroides sp.]|nr:T9SS type A sorting domain-containing protein [Bacteroides sp.]